MTRVYNVVLFSLIYSISLSQEIPCHTQFATNEGFQRADCLRNQSQNFLNEGNLQMATKSLWQCVNETHFDTLQRFNDWITLLDYHYKIEVTDFDSMSYIIKNAELLLEKWSGTTEDLRLIYLSNAGKADLLMQNYASAISKLKDVIRINEENGNKSVNHVGTYINLGGAYLDSKNPTYGLNALANASELLKTLDEYPPIFPAALAYSRGRGYQDTRQYDESYNTFNESKSLYAAIFGTEEHPAIYSCLSYQTNNLIGQGRYQKAVDNAKFVIEKNSLVYECPSEELYFNYLELGRAYYKSSNYQMALEANDNAFDCVNIDLSTIQPNEFITTPALLNGIGQRLDILTINNDTIAINQLIIQGNRLLSEHTSLYDSDDDLKFDLGIIRSYVESLVNIHLRNPSKHSYLEALAAIEFIKPQFREKTINKGDLGTLDQVRQAISEVDNNIFQQKIFGDDVKQLLDLQSKKNQLLEDRLAMIKDLKAQDKLNIFSLKDHDFSEKLNGKQFLSYFLGEDNIYIICYAQGKFHHSITPRNHKKETLWTNSIESSLMSNGEEMYQYLVSPVSQHLSEDQLIISTDGWIGLVPFSALKKQGKYLLEQYAISYTPNLTQYGQAMKSKSSKRIIGFAPSFSKGQIQLASLLRSSENNALGPLAFNTVEVERLGTYGGTNYIGNKASKENFLANANGAHIVHISTHAEADPVDHSFNRVFFTGLDGAQSLYGAEVRQLDLNADLVVISACETGAGNVYSGGGVNSIAHDFLKGGASSVVSTLFKVNDQSTSVIMSYFYELLDEGLPKDKALQQAKIKYLANNSNLGISPSNWAGLTLMGNTHPVTLKSSGMRWILYALVAVAILFFLFKMITKGKQ